MLVIATKVGFHGSLRQPDDVFEVPDGAKAASWFEPVAAEPAKPVKAAKPAKPAADQPLA